MTQTRHTLRKRGFSTVFFTGLAYFKDEPVTKRARERDIPPHSGSRRQPERSGETSRAGELGPGSGDGAGMELGRCPGPERAPAPPPPAHLRRAQPPARAPRRPPPPPYWLAATP